MAASSLTFQLPIPSPALSPNARGHWSGKAAAAKAARALAKAEGLRVIADSGAPAPKWQRASFKAVLFAPKRRADWDNFIASLKPSLDGLADAGVVANDRGLWPERPEFVQVARMPRVEITVTEEP